MLICKAKVGPKLSKKLVRRVGIALRTLTALGTTAVTRTADDPSHSALAAIGGQKDIAAYYRCMAVGRMWAGRHPGWKSAI